MNARIKPWSVVMIDWQKYIFEKEFWLNLTTNAVKLVQNFKNDFNSVLSSKWNDPDSINIQFEWSNITIKIEDILLLNEINSHRAIIPKFSEYFDESWKAHALNKNIILKLWNIKAIKILNLIKLYNEDWEDNYIDLDIPNFWNIKVHIKNFLLSTSNISPIDTKKVFIDEWTPIKEIIESPNKETWNSDVSTIPAKIDFTMAPNINMPLERILEIKHWLFTIPTDKIKSFTHQWKTFQFNISDLHLTH